MSTSLPTIGAAFDAVYKEIHKQPSINLDAEAAELFRVHVFRPIFRRLRYEYHQLAWNKNSPVHLPCYVLNTRKYELDVMSHLIAEVYRPYLSGMMKGLEDLLTACEFRLATFTVSSWETCGAIRICASIRFKEMQNWDDDRGQMLDFAAVVKDDEKGARLLREVQTIDQTILKHDGD